jgi:hypothetical protein
VFALCFTFFSNNTSHKALFLLKNVFIVYKVVKFFIYVFLSISFLANFIILFTFSWFHFPCFACYLLALPPLPTTYITLYYSFGFYAWVFENLSKKVSINSSYYLNIGLELLMCKTNKAFRKKTWTYTNKLVFFLIGLFVFFCFFSLN